MSKRLLREYQDLMGLKENYGLTPDGDNLLKWRCVIVGPRGTQYEGRTYDVELDVDPAYPFKPPTLKFITPITHSRVISGKMCLESVEMWKPDSRLIDVVKDAIRALKEKPPTQI